ncbi:hypothetical protein DFH08DRAFT_811563 [Mycena albidolilacea]|uniref:Uncharacterized protein n=1 Tax=Mycena albidolilacea TaxID=1033008 RepID=A0AAD6ZW55_9AGAR|nr:hypothetical protein DFH08DRAFT_811563 [Mycena albidolilacea]
MRFTIVVSFLAAVTAAHAGAIENHQGCPGTKVCPTNTVLKCCKGVNFDEGDGGGTMVRMRKDKRRRWADRMYGIAGVLNHFFRLDRLNRLNHFFPHLSETECNEDVNQLHQLGDGSRSEGYVGKMQADPYTDTYVDMLRMETHSPLKKWFEPGKWFKQKKKFKQKKQFKLGKNGSNGKKMVQTGKKWFKRKKQFKLQQNGSNGKNGSSGKKRLELGQNGSNGKNGLNREKMVQTKTVQTVFIGSNHFSLNHPSPLIAARLCMVRTKRFELSSHWQCNSLNWNAAAAGQYMVAVNFD